jgi:2-oxoglutarate/2-oxoacid ferredoxin oxidoreductase subunit beta
MPGLVPGIHVFLFGGQDVDGRDEPGHDEDNAMSHALEP